MIIDTHVHCGVVNGFYMPEHMVEEMIKKFNIDHIILSDCRGCEHTEELEPIPVDEAYSQNEILKDNISFARKHPGRVSVMPWIKPNTDGVDNEFIKLIKNNIDVVRGIKFHAHNSKLRTDSELLEPYYEVAAKYELPVAVHTGGIEEASVKYVYNAAKKHEDVNFIMVHMGLGTDNSEAIEYMSKQQNLYGDTTWVPMENIIKTIEKCGSDRIVFGTDSPIDGLDTYIRNGSGEPSMYIDYFKKFPKLVSEEVYEKIMYKNAARLFKLDVDAIKKAMNK